MSDADSALEQELLSGEGSERLDIGRNRKRLKWYLLACCEYFGAITVRRSWNTINVLWTFHKRFWNWNKKAIRLKSGWTRTEKIKFEFIRTRTQWGRSTREFSNPWSTCRTCNWTWGREYNSNSKSNWGKDTIKIFKNIIWWFSARSKSSQLGMARRIDHAPWLEKLKLLPKLRSCSKMSL